MISPVKIWRRQKEIRKLLGNTGKIFTWTLINVAAKEFKKYAPYPVAIVQLDNGIKVTAAVVDFEQADLRIGKKVKIVLRKVRESGAEDVLVYGIKIKPI